MRAPDPVEFRDITRLSFEIYERTPIDESPPLPDTAAPDTTTRTSTTTGKAGARAPAPAPSSALFAPATELAGSISLLLNATNLAGAALVRATGMPEPLVERIRTLRAELYVQEANIAASVHEPVLWRRKYPKSRSDVVTDTEKYARAYASAYAYAACAHIVPYHIHCVRRRCCCGSGA